MNCSDYARNYVADWELPPETAIEALSEITLIIQEAMEKLSEIQVEVPVLEELKDEFESLKLNYEEV